MVERLLAKQKVVGSNPIVRSRNIPGTNLTEKRENGSGVARYPSGLREGFAKPRFVGSNPTRASMTHLATLKIQK